MSCINTSRDLLAKLEADFADYAKQPGSGRLALNCAMTAYHLNEWVWEDWLRADFTTRKALGIGKDRRNFLTWIKKACPWFAVVQDLTSGAKQFTPRDSCLALLVSRRPFMFDPRGLNIEKSISDEGAPYETDANEFLLFDFGPLAAEHQLVPAVLLIEVVVRFWRKFFVRFAPPCPQQVSIDGARAL